MISPAIAKEINPLVIASCPKEGPTTTDCTISAEAGNLPARSTLAKSCASNTVKLPVIWVLPPAIGPEVTLGAEYTILSSTIAIFPFSVNTFPVRFSHILAPSLFIFMDTQGWLWLS